MIRYEQDGELILKSSSKGIEPLEDIVDELNDNQQLIYKMASLLQSIVKVPGVINLGMRAEAKDLARQVREKM